MFQCPLVAAAEALEVHPHRLEVATSAQRHRVSELVRLQSPRRRRRRATVHHVEGNRVVGGVRVAGAASQTGGESLFVIVHSAVPPPAIVPVHPAD